MKTQNKKLDVIILCGGKGERLRPLTQNIPKPMVKINKKPIIYYILSYLKSKDIRRVFVTTGYKHKVVHSYLDSLNIELDLKMIFSGQADIIQRIKDAGKYISGDFLVLYGDTISDVNIKNLVKFHRQRKFKATMTTWSMRSNFGIVNFNNNGKVLSFLEKPILDKYMNIGYFYFNKEMLNLMNFYDSWEVFLKALVKKGVLAAFKHDGIHITVNTIDELRNAEKDIKKLLI
jgi:glucose-1-phosphate cytidylyltransferase